MNKLKLTSTISLLSVLIVGLMSSVASAQSMSTALNAAGTISLQDPYCSGNYPPLNTVGSLTADEKAAQCPTIPATPLTTIPANVVDWILLELRAVTGSNTSVNNANAATVVARKPAFILNNGRIVDAEEYTGADPTVCTGTTEHANCPDVVFDQGNIMSAISGKELYLAVWHRNHLAIISSDNLTETNGTYTYDFTTNVTQARGGDTGLKNVTGKGVAMYGGDVDQNGNINLDDYNAGILVNDGLATYLASDADLNTNTNLEDYNALVLVNDGKARQTP